MFSCRLCKRLIVLLAFLLVVVMFNDSLTFAATNPASNSLRPIQQGTLVADLGFRPESNGFSFENYGSESAYQNLTPADVRRIFGDQVCASLANGQCTLTPPAQQWMQQENSSMGGGHCYGFSVLSLAMFQNKIPATNFGGNTASQLAIQNNVALQQELAYSFVHQSFPSVTGSQIQGTPNEILDKLIAVLQPGTPEAYTIGIFKADGGGGHAVTPYAVEDVGGGKFNILVYDNNYPQTTRRIAVDRNANTWAYEASTNPNVQADLYTGNAQTRSMSLLPMTPGLTQQPCYICEGGGQASANSDRQAFAETTRSNQIWLDGEGVRLRLTDGQGRNTGFVGGTLVNEIPGAEVQRTFSDDLWADSPPPVYTIPVGTDFTISIDGSGLTEAQTADVLMLGPGYALEVSEISLAPGQVDTMDISPDGSFISYRSTTGESPDILVGIEEPGADYVFLVNGFDIEPGGAINITLDIPHGDLILDSIDNQTTGSYELLMGRIDDAGEQVFGSNEITLDPDDVIYVNYLNWPGNSMPMSLDVDRGGDGTIDETIEIADITDDLDHEEQQPEQPTAAPEQPTAAPEQPTAPAQATTEPGQATAAPEQPTSPAQPTIAPTQATAPAQSAPITLPNTGVALGNRRWIWLLVASGLVFAGLVLRRRIKH